MSSDASPDENGFRLMVGERLPWIPYALLFPVLLILSWIYSSLIRSRNFLYDLSIFKQHSVNARVVSVGNITTGGTGKTPLVECIAREAVHRGFKTGAVARGYKRSGGAMNDEGMWLTRKVPDLKLIQDPDRVTAARRAVADRGAEFIIMDDGFQHRRLKRDLDLVVVDATLPFGYGRVLPAGLLREPLSSLKRAHAFVLTRCDQVDTRRLEEIESELEGKPVYRSEHAPLHLLRIKTGEELGLDQLADEKVFLLSGIANPRAFERTVASLDATIVGHSVFADHHGYTEEEVDRVMHQAASMGAKQIVTTAKDGVKLEHIPSAKKILILEIGLNLQREGEFFQLVFA